LNRTQKDGIESSFKSNKKSGLILNSILTPIFCSISKALNVVFLGAIQPERVYTICSLQIGGHQEIMQDMGENYLKFWGTRGSSAVSGEAYRYFGGNTSCVEIHNDGHYIIIDAGTGIRPLGLVLQKKNVRKIDLFLSHIHWDHVIGLPFFEPVYHLDAHITIWSLPGNAYSGKQLLDQLFATDFFPVEAEKILGQIEFRTIASKSSIQIGSVRVEHHLTNHPGIACGFRFKFGNSIENQTIGYVTDNEMFKGFHGALSELSSQDLKPYESFISFFSGCDLLVHEAQYFPEEYRIKMGWGHSSVRNAVAFIQRTLPNRWLVTHHDPTHTDEDLFRLADLAKQLLLEHKIPCSVEWVPDGYVIIL
jgi:phosphoribosyl 1,2-cyclic phosphodiesterase